MMNKIAIVCLALAATVCITYGQRPDGEPRQRPDAGTKQKEGVGKYRDIYNVRVLNIIKVLYCNVQRLQTQIILV